MPLPHEASRLGAVHKREEVPPAGIVGLLPPNAVLPAIAQVPRGLRVGLLADAHDGALAGEAPEQVASLAVGVEDLAQAPGGEPDGGDVEGEEDGVLGVGLGAREGERGRRARAQERGDGGPVGLGDEAEREPRVGGHEREVPEERLQFLRGVRQGRRRAVAVLRRGWERERDAAWVVGSGEGV